MNSSKVKWESKLWFLLERQYRVKAFTFTQPSLIWSSATYVPSVSPRVIGEHRAWVSPERHYVWPKKQSLSHPREKWFLKLTFLTFKLNMSPLHDFLQKSFLSCATSTIFVFGYPLLSATWGLLLAMLGVPGDARDWTQGFPLYAQLVLPAFALSDCRTLNAQLSLHVCFFNLFSLQLYTWL